MKNIINGLAKWVVLAICMASFALVPTLNVQAEGFGIAVAPMNQEAVLIPGDTFEASFRISNPNSATEDAYYELSVEPFYINDKKEIIYDTMGGDSNEIVKWISFKVPTEGKLEPNKVEEIKFEVNVPKDAAAGGQYASIIVTMKSKSEQEGDESDNKNSGATQTTIKETKRIAHLFYAEIAGNVTRNGEITEINVPSFLLSGNIMGSSSIKNLGNVHGKAYYKMQIFPLFSNEEVFTNEEDVESHTILPNQTLYNETIWNETPAIGLFNVVYTVDFEGSTAKIEKLVIKCPVWLLFIVIFAIIALIIWVFLLIKKRSTARRG